LKCFYHNDMDGRCAASIVADYTTNYHLADYIEVDYTKPLSTDIIELNEDVYIVDYSFKDNTVYQLQEILAKTKNVIWIDHHTSSLNLIKQMPELNNIKGLIRDKISGAALTYMYLYKRAFDDLPKYIKLVSDYDCWQYCFGDETTYFKLGLETYNFNALDDVWIKLFNSTYSYKTEEIIEIGELIKNYIDKDNEYYLSHFGYESELDGYKCYVVNKKSNSWIFGNKYNEYPFVVVYVFDGNQYTYSLFSSNKDIDCSKIAEKLGGGGHKGAAGFCSKELLLKKI
jgi:uncharacterized protein